MIKDIRNLFRLKKETNGTTISDVRNLLTLEKEIDDTKIKDTRNLFTLKNENEAIKAGIIRDFRNIFKHDKEDY